MEVLVGDGQYSDVIGLAATDTTALEPVGTSTWNALNNTHLLRHHNKQRIRRLVRFITSIKLQ